MDKHIKYDLTKTILASIDDLSYRGYINSDERDKMINSIPYDLIKNYTELSAIF